MLGSVPDRSSPSPAEPPSRMTGIGFGTIAMALAALSMALFAYFSS
jgi:hypothetical protein